MTRGLQITIDCIDARRLVPFWVNVLAYIVEPPPDGAASWNDYWRSRAVPEEELPTDHDAADSIIDPQGVGPRIWFQQVPEAKAVKNRLHLDVDVGGGRHVPVAERERLVTAEADRLVGLGATRVNVLRGATDHFGIVMQDPEGNEFCLH